PRSAARSRPGIARAYSVAGARGGCSRGRRDASADWCRQPGSRQRAPPRASPGHGGASRRSPRAPPPGGAARRLASGGDESGCLGSRSWLRQGREDALESSVAGGHLGALLARLAQELLDRRIVFDGLVDLGVAALAVGAEADQLRHVLIRR